MSVTSILFKELAEIRRSLPEPPALPTCSACGGKMPHVRVGGRHAGCKAAARDRELKLTDSLLVTFAVRELELTITGRLRDVQQGVMRDLMVATVISGWKASQRARAREKAKERRREKKEAVLQ